MEKTQLSSLDFESRLRGLQKDLANYRLGMASISPSSNLFAAYKSVIASTERAIERLIASQEPKEIVYNEDEWE